MSAANGASVVLPDGARSQVKQTRGSYARLICSRCRERKIKCKLPPSTLQFIHPSDNPQPPENSCERCMQRGYDCVVQRTTLGRPLGRKREAGYARRQAEHNTSSITSGLGGYSRRYEQRQTGRVDNRDSRKEFDRSSRSLSPYIEDFILINPDGDPSRRETGYAHQPTKIELINALHKTFTLTSALLARDREFGSAISQLATAMPGNVFELVDADVASVLNAQ
jgi:hypothetical protein